MATQTKLVTADELLISPLNQERCELINGEVIMMSPAGFEHGAIGVRLAARLDEFVSTHRLGVIVGADTGFILTRNPDTVRAPDVAFVSNDRLKAVGITKKFFPGSPDLAVEIVSPDDRPQDVQDKALQWLAAGTFAVWVINPAERNVKVYRSPNDAQTFGESDTFAGCAVLPGFSLSLRDILFNHPAS
jgi:Uma2 family endonuclease